MHVPNLAETHVVFLVSRMPMGRRHSLQLEHPKLCLEIYTRAIQYFSWRILH